MRTLQRLLSQFGSLFFRRQAERRLREEVEEHLALLTEDHIRAGMPPAEARRQAVLAFGPVEAIKEAYRDQRGLPGLDAFLSDVVFGWRQLRKHPAASAAALLSLALAIGSSTATFRLVDAVLLRTLRVADPERLFFLATTFVDREGRPDYNDDFDYPTFRRYREATAPVAETMVIGIVSRQDATFDRAEEPEKVSREYLSGNVFAVFGLQPALGRLLSPSDDRTPGAHPVAVLSYDYWTRRFARNPGVLGQTFRMGDFRFEIIGVAPEGFIGTEPGEVAEVFVPAMMNVQAINSPGWSWFRIWVRPKPGVSPEQVREPLQAVFTREHQERIKGFHSDTPRQTLDAFLKERVLLMPAGAGASGLQRTYRRPLLVLSFLVILVLLVACVNIANLLTAQAAARAREMALRVSIGAGRWRLIQLVLIQSALLSIGASVLGAILASWFAPLVTSMLRVPQDPVRLVLQTGWREVAFSATLALLVTLLFGLLPALRASAVHPIQALKGAGEARPRRFLQAALALQVAFCILVLFLAGLFVHTFERLVHRPLGFSPERLLTMDVSAGKQFPPEAWMQITDQLHGVPGVQSVSLAAWPLLSMNRWTGTVQFPGRTVELRQPYFLEVAPGFLATMRIGMIEGRDFRPGDLQPRLDASQQPLAGVGIVNETFARVFLEGRNPVGALLNVRQSKDRSAPLEIIGYVRDAAYRNLREPVPPTIYLPMGQREHNTVLVRTAGDPVLLAPALRQEVVRARSSFRVRTIQTQEDFVRWHLVRERLLATLSLFFAIMALLLAATGLYGMIHYSVTRRRREIGIRMALGARTAEVLKRVTGEFAAMMSLGAVAGITAGFMSARFVESLLFEVRATDWAMLLTPVAVLGSVAILAGLPPALRATRIDPAQTLRNE